jgi:hypothetical protein
MNVFSNKRSQAVAEMRPAAPKLKTDVGTETTGGGFERRFCVVLLSVIFAVTTAVCLVAFTVANNR